MKHLKLSVLITRGMYGPRVWNHWGAYYSAPGWLFVELGAWTIEIDHPTWGTK